VYSHITSKGSGCLAPLLWALCNFTVKSVNKIKEQLLATDLADWRKRGIFTVVILLSVFPFFITYKTSLPDLEDNLWQLRHFVGIAAIQAVAQISLAWYILKNKVPNYVIGSFIIIAMFFQVTYGMLVILPSNA
jgi:hypothetical protein